MGLLKEYLETKENGQERIGDVECDNLINAIRFLGKISFAKFWKRKQHDVDTEAGEPKPKRRR